MNYRELDERDTPEKGLVGFVKDDKKSFDLSREDAKGIYRF